MKQIIVLALIVFVSGCSMLTPPAKIRTLNKNQSYLIDYNTARRGTIVYNKEATWQSCAEPAPDTALSTLAKLSLGQNRNLELNQSVIELAGRTEKVLLLRESLYRVCELTLNINLSMTEAETLYLKVFDTIKELVNEPTKTAMVNKEMAKINLDAEREKSANTAKFIYKYLSENNISHDVIQGLLKEWGRQ